MSDRARGCAERVTCPADRTTCESPTRQRNRAALQARAVRIGLPVHGKLSSHPGLSSVTLRGGIFGRHFNARWSHIPRPTWPALRGPIILKNLATRGLNVPTRVSNLTYSMWEKRKSESGCTASAKLTRSASEGSQELGASDGTCGRTPAVNQQWSRESNLRRRESTKHMYT
jgi:hypothetical protein